MPSEFDRLVAEMNAEQEAMTKAMAADDAGKGDDKDIQAAAEDGQEASDKDADKKDDDDEGEEGEAFGKSFSVTLENGETVEAIDGTAMMKALHAENAELKTETASMNKALAAALGAVTGLTKAMGEQAAMLKALRGDVARIGGQGTGRKTTLTVHEKPNAGGAAAEPEGIQPGELMAKALSAMQAGKITGSEASRLESYVGRGLQPPADIVAKIAS